MDERYGSKQEIKYFCRGEKEGHPVYSQQAVCGARWPWLTRQQVREDARRQGGEPKYVEDAGVAQWKSG